MRKQIQAALEKGVQFLKKNQKAEGEFPCYASENTDMSGSFYDSTPFITSFVLYSLSVLPEEFDLSLTIKRGLDFLFSQMEGPGIWRYFGTENPRRNDFPPDLDDTACISYLLKRYKYPFPDNRWIFRENSDADGVYYTWMVQRPGSGSEKYKQLLGQLNTPQEILNILAVNKVYNIDSSVVANVLLYLGESEVTAPAVTYLVEVVNNFREHEEKTYYPDIEAFYYMVSRAYINGVASLKKIKKTVVKRIQNKWKTGFSAALSTALGFCALLNYGSENSEPLKAAANYLLKVQNYNGSWDMARFYDGREYFGSSELTTAIALESLAVFQRRLY